MSTYEIRIQNFKSFYDSKWIQLRPLTILLGPNNAGKTSFFLPLLALKQTIDSPNEEIGFKTKGPYVDLGLYRDIVHRHVLSKPMKFSLKLLTERGRKRPKSLEPVGSYPPGEVTFEFSNSSTGYPELRSFEVRDIYDRLFLKRTRLEKGKFGLRYKVKRPEEHTPLLNRFLKAIKEQDPYYFLFDDDFIVEVLKREVYTEGTRSADRKLNEVTIPAYVAKYSAAVRIVLMATWSFLDRILFLGPLRQAPQRYYESNEEATSYVGPRGEHTANVLLHRFGNTAASKNLKKWLGMFDLASDFKAESQRRDSKMFTVQLKTGTARFVNVADMGFGCSQLLPLIVQGLIAKKNTLIIAEQPEIHLNPKLQTTVGDLLVHFVKEGKQVLLETHSEHIILRLRTLVAEGRIKPDQVALYFVEKKGSASKMRAIQIDAKGRMKGKWPKDFFADGLQQAVKLANAQMKGKLD